MEGWEGVLDSCNIATSMKTCRKNMSQPPWRALAGCWNRVSHWGVFLGVAVKPRKPGRATEDVGAWLMWE